jgi:hypothetical protein
MKMPSRSDSSESPIRDLWLVEHAHILYIRKGAEAELKEIDFNFN